MASNPGPIGDIVKEYIKKFPSTPSNRLAEKIVLDIPTIGNKESIRGKIRYYRGASGEYNRKCILKDNYMPRFELPDSEPEDCEPYIFTGQYPIVIFADVHTPYHDLDALDICLERAYSIKAKTIIINGDFFDCYMMSKFCKDPRKRSMKEELEIGKSIFETIRKSFPDITIIFKFGNHEERYDDYIKINSPNIFGLESTHLINQIDKEKYKIDVVDNKRIIKISHLHIIHGHEYGNSMTNPVNPARGLYLRAKKTAFCNHYHQTSEHTETAINGGVVTDWSGGCLCGLHPYYLPNNKWNHGFAEVYNDDDYFTIHNRRIISYKLV